MKTKRNFFYSMQILILLFLTPFSSAVCSLDVSLINQDPYPAIPGDYVKLVFQMTGTENPECVNVFFELVEDFPISFDPGTELKVTVKGGTFVKDYPSYLMIPYKVKIDENALDGDNPITVRYGSDDSGKESFEKQFNVYVKDVRADFEIYLKSYDSSSNTLTLEILNIGKNDVEALAAEIPQQENIILKGPNKKILGSLDANDYTTVDFNLAPLDSFEGSIDLIIRYTDETGVRRTLNKTLYFNSFSFQTEKSTKKKNFIYYLVAALIVIFIAYRIYKKHEKKRKA